MIDQVRPENKDMQSTRLVDLIQPGHPNSPKIISRCIQFCSQFSIRFKGFFFYKKVMILNAYLFIEVHIQKSNYNVMNLIVI